MDIDHLLRALNEVALVLSIEPRPWGCTAVTKSPYPMHDVVRVTLQQGVTVQEAVDKTAVEFAACCKRGVDAGWTKELGVTEVHLNNALRVLGG